MSLYKTGTVSVNNGQNTVTGNGTSFIDVANVQLGDLFTVNGSKFYEIYQVDTNTQLRIRNIVTGGAFAETTVTDGDYAIVRNFTSQTSAEIAAKVLAVQQKWQNREEEMTDWFYSDQNWATVTSINGDELTVMTPEGINNLLAPGAFGPDCREYGLGAVKSMPSGTSLLSITDNGLYYIPSATDTPSALTANWVVLVNTTNNSTYRTVKAWGVGKLGNKYGEFTNTLENGAWGGWRTVFDSGNTNFNTITINSGGTKLGIAPFSTRVDLEFTLNSYIVPTSITVSGTVSVVDVTTNNTIATGVTPTFVGSSSARNLIIGVPATVTGGRAYRVIADAGNLNITVNF